MVQGSLYASNLTETANTCLHWRRLFPEAEIILSIATTDLVEQSCGQVRTLARLDLSPPHRLDGVLQVAARRLSEACDHLVLSEGALPLPPIKFDRKVNNTNLQIVAAKAGLSRATREYVLRVRSDFVFLDRSLLSFYARNARLTRHHEPAFRQRVMISPFFTLNPFTMERLPFHFSDWFHFGLLGDVRKLWDVEEMSLADAVYFEGHTHPRGTNALERKFRMRLAVEQHLAFGSLSRCHRDLRLDHLVDRHSAERSIQILLNEFLIYDPREVPTAFDKYARTFRDPMMELLCITYPQWRALLDLGPDADLRSLYARAAKRARWEILIREHPTLKPFKTVRGAWRLLRRNRDELSTILRELGGGR